MEIKSKDNCEEEMKAIRCTTTKESSTEEQRWQRKRYEQRTVPPITCNNVCFGARRVRINVSGVIFETWDSTLGRFPNTLLGCPARRRRYFDEVRREYFFNRNRNAFDAILFYYQSLGIVFRPANVRPQEFYEELNFFDLGRDVVRGFMIDEGLISDVEEKPELPQQPAMRKLWLWFEYPQHSGVSKLVASWSVTFILLSIFVLSVETLQKDTKQGGQTSTTGRFTIYNCLEAACVLWFALEFLLRLISCPSKLKFMSNFMNLVDLAAVLPYIITSAIGDVNMQGGLKALRLLRVFRIFKLARHLDGLRVLGRTIYSTWRELLMILFFVLITTIIFSSLCFYAEYETQPQTFSSIPATAWFVIISLTNVGYGDIVPMSVFGKLLGTACALAGVLVIALPSPVIATKFLVLYNEEKQRRIRQAAN